MPRRASVEEPQFIFWLAFFNSAKMFSSHCNKNSSTSAQPSFDPTDLLRKHINLPSSSTFIFNPTFNSLAAKVTIWNALPG